MDPTIRNRQKCLIYCSRNCIVSYCISAKANFLTWKHITGHDQCHGIVLLEKVSPQRACMPNMNATYNISEAIGWYSSGLICVTEGQTDGLTNKSIFLLKAFHKSIGGL